MLAIQKQRRSGCPIHFQISVKRVTTAQPTQPLQLFIRTHSHSNATWGALRRSPPVLLKLPPNRPPSASSYINVGYRSIGLLTPPLPAPPRSPEELFPRLSLSVPYPPLRAPGKLRALPAGTRDPGAGSRPHCCPPHGRFRVLCCVRFPQASGWNRESFICAPGLPVPPEGFRDAPEGPEVGLEAGEALCQDRGSGQHAVRMRIGWGRGGVGVAVEVVADGLRGWAGVVVYGEAPPLKRDRFLCWRLLFSGGWARLNVNPCYTLLCDCGRHPARALSCDRHCTVLHCVPITSGANLSSSKRAAGLEAAW